MRSINRYLLALATLVLFVPFGAASAQSPTASVATEYLMTLEAICDRANRWGSGSSLIARAAQFMDQRSMEQ